MPSITSPSIIPLDYSENRDSKYLDCSNTFLALNAEGQYVLFDFSKKENVIPDEIFEIKFNNEDNQGFIDTIKTIKKVHKDGTLSVEDDEDLRTSANQFLGSKIYRSGFSDDSVRLSNSDDTDTDKTGVNDTLGLDDSTAGHLKETSVNITPVVTAENKNILQRIKEFFAKIINRKNSGNEFIKSESGYESRRSLDLNNNDITGMETTPEAFGSTKPTTEVNVITGSNPEEKAEEANAHLLKKFRIFEI